MSTIRRLPVYLLIDCSESMVGEALDAVQAGIQSLVDELSGDPTAIETVWISVITFSSRATQLVPLTDILQFQPPALNVGPGTCLGSALDLLGQCIQREVKLSTSERKADWKPIVFLLTDGAPTDRWNEAANRFKAQFSKGVPTIIAVGCGCDADLSVLKDITPNAFLMRDATESKFAQFFKWVSASVSTASVAVGRDGGAIGLPQMPTGTFETATESRTSGSPKHLASQVIFAARCSKTSQVYLMRYQLDPVGKTSYAAEAAYPVGSDYLAESFSGGSGVTLDSKKLKGAPACPYCGNAGWKPSRDNRLLECSTTLQVGISFAQVMFVLDITGSMSSEIEGVKENIKSFMDFIKSEGLAVEVGLVAFRDLQFGEPPELLQFDGQSFTTDASSFRRQVSRLQAFGGGDNNGESSLDALALACRQTFKEGSERIIILITDEPPLLPDGEFLNREDVILALRRAGITQLHLVIPSQLQEAYAFLLHTIKGRVFFMRGDERGGCAFQNILREVGRNITLMTRIG